MYALVRTGGKQYRVEEGRSIKIERLPGDAGDTIELGEVLLMGDGDAITIGTPTIEGARIVGTIAEQGRAKKILVFHFRNKTRHKKKNGHRQHFTRFVVDDILAAGQEPKPKTAKAEPVAEAAPVEAPKGRRARRAAESATAEAPAVVEATPEPTETAAPKAAAADEASEATKTAAPKAAATEAPAAKEKPKRTRKKTE